LSPHATTILSLLSLLGIAFDARVQILEKKIPVLVSVVMPTYNGSRYVLEAIRSVLSQSHSPLELVIVDDGSTDSTCEVVTSLNDHRIQLVRQENSGVASARNTGLARARGPLVAFLDQDDSWASEKIIRQVPLFSDPTIGIAGSLMSYVGSSGRKLGTSGELADHQQDRIAAARLMPFAPSSIVARTELLRSLGGFDAELARTVAPIDDLDLVSRVAQTHRIVTVPETLGTYRVHAEAGSFAKFYEMQRGTRFLQARIAARQRGADLTWQDWSSTTVDSKAVQRREKARFHYRRAGFGIASGQPVRGLIDLAVATGLAPNYTLPRLRRQLIGS
jgi:glycosyltransferase involved in cell wall biosynthesis